MTQREEMAKKLKKILSIHSIEEKESERLPEFTEPFRFRVHYFNNVKMRRMN